MLTSGDARLIATLLVIVAVPYALEWWYSGKRLGIFGILFWLYTLQWLLILLLLPLADRIKDGGLPALASVLAAPAALSWLLIGAVPFVLEPIAIIRCLVRLIARLAKERKTG